MQFHFEKTLEKRYEPQVTVTNETPAWLMICLAESIKDWIGQSPRIFCKSEEPYLQFGYEVLTFPVAEFAQIFGPLIYAINQAWPVQVFGMGSQDELVELSFTKEGDSPHYPAEERLRDSMCGIERPVLLREVPGSSGGGLYVPFAGRGGEKVCCRGPGVGVRRFSGTAAAGKN